MKLYSRGQRKKFRSYRSSGVTEVQEYGYATLREQEFRSCRSYKSYRAIKIRHQSMKKLFI
jgi:hypothetical protein